MKWNKIINVTQSQRNNIKNKQTKNGKVEQALINSKTPN